MSTEVWSQNDESRKENIVLGEQWIQLWVPFGYHFEYSISDTNYDSSRNCSIQLLVTEVQKMARRRSAKEFFSEIFQMVAIPILACTVMLKTFARTIWYHFPLKEACPFYGAENRCFAQQQCWIMIVMDMSEMNILRKTGAKIRSTLSLTHLHSRRKGCRTLSRIC